MNKCIHFSHLLFFPTISNNIVKHCLSEKLQTTAQERFGKIERHALLAYRVGAPRNP